MFSKRLTFHIQALKGFEEVIKMEPEKGKWGFKALKQMCKVLFTLGRLFLSNCCISVRRPAPPFLFRASSHHIPNCNRATAQLRIFRFWLRSPSHVLTPSLALLILPSHIGFRYRQPQICNDPPKSRVFGMFIRGHVIALAIRNAARPHGQFARSCAVARKSNDDLLLWAMPLLSP